MYLPCLLIYATLLSCAAVDYLVTIACRVPLLMDIGGELAARWLPGIAAGESRVAVGLEQNLLVEDAHLADLLLLQSGPAVHAARMSFHDITYRPRADTL